MSLTPSNSSPLKKFHQQRASEYAPNYLQQPYIVEELAIPKHIKTESSSMKKRKPSRTNKNHHESHNVLLPVRIHEDDVSQLRNATDMSSDLHFKSTHVDQHHFMDSHGPMDSHHSQHMSMATEEYQAYGIQHGSRTRKQSRKGSKSSKHGTHSMGPR